MIIFFIPSNDVGPGSYGAGEKIYEGEPPRKSSSGIEKSWLASYREIIGHNRWEVWNALQKPARVTVYSLEEAKAEMMRMAIIVRLTR